MQKLDQVVSLFAYLHFSDVNECVDELQVCDQNAVCSNTDGSFTCVCAEGWTGDGKLCLGKSIIEHVKMLGHHPSFFKFIVSSFKFYKHRPSFNSSDGRVLRASASGIVDSGLNPSRVKPMTVKLLFTAFLLDA